MNEALTTADLTHEIIQAFPGMEFTLSHESRREAIRSFERIGFPGKKNEEYRFTPVTRSIEKNFTSADFIRSAPSSTESIDAYLIPSYDCNRIVFVNGQFSQRLSSIISTKDQLVVKPLSQAFTEDPQIIATCFAKLSNPSSDAFGALNTALWREGVFIRIPENKKVEKPVFILHLHDAKDAKVISQTRVLAFIDKNSELSLIEKFDTTGNEPVFNSVVEEIEVGENARLNYYKIQNDPGQMNQVTNTVIHQSDASRVNTFTMSMDGQLVRNNLQILIDGEGCESHFNGLYLLHGNSHVDNHTVVDHRKPNSFSNELYKGVMDGNSRGVFNGKIYVRPHAQKTNAFQSNRNILLSDTSTINTKPQLEIWADDVKCSHGCTSGQLDEEALFYLQSRGISRQIARAMVLYAFAVEVIEPIRDPQLKNYLDQLISGRLQKNL